VSPANFRYYREEYLVMTTTGNQARAAGFTGLGDAISGRELDAPGPALAGPGYAAVKDELVRLARGPGAATA
jgi:hypothetical protein